jgi:hypothetical protein
MLSKLSDVQAGDKSLFLYNISHLQFPACSALVVQVHQGLVMVDLFIYAFLSNCDLYFIFIFSNI